MDEYLGNLKRKEDMEIKDVINKYALPFLPAKTLLRSRLVCKEWDQRIMHPFLAHQQSHTFRHISGFFCQFFTQFFTSRLTFVTLSHPAYGVPSPSLDFFPENDVVIRSSCNGLLLCQGSDEAISFYICNPVNKECVSLPPSAYYQGFEPSVVLAFEPSVLNVAANYDVICAVMSLDHSNHVYFDIYSSQTKQWRYAPEIFLELGNETLTSNGFYIKGIAYWFTSSNKVVAFDPKNDLVQILYLQSESEPGAILAERHGELCYIRAHYQNGNAYTIEFYGGMDMSLKDSVSLNVEFDVTDEQIQILALTNDDVLFLVVGNVLFSYQMKDRRVTKISEMEIGPRMRFLPYVNSLVNVAQN